MRTEIEMMDLIRGWGEESKNVRAILLEGSKVRPDAQLDFLSDFDIEVYVNNLENFSTDDWLSKFGDVLVKWPDKPRATGPWSGITRLVLFQDHNRIDFQISTISDIRKDTYDDGFQVILDKDNLLDNIPAPTFTKYLIKKPTGEKFADCVTGFWWDATYIPKYMHRDEAPMALRVFEGVLRFELLHNMLDWYIGLSHDWNVKTGLNGKRYKKLLPSEIWNKYCATYFAFEEDAIWKSFDTILDLFSELAKEVASGLGFEYSEDQEQRVREFCTMVRNSPRKDC